MSLQQAVYLYASIGFDSSEVRWLLHPARMFVCLQDDKYVVERAFVNLLLHITASCKQTDLIFDPYNVHRQKYEMQGYS